MIFTEQEEQEGEKENCLMSPIMRMVKNYQRQLLRNRRGIAQLRDGSQTTESTVFSLRQHNRQILETNAMLRRLICASLRARSSFRLGADCACVGA
jgi:hypothetical protein